MSFAYFVWDKLIEASERDASEQMSCGPFFCNCYGFLMIFGTVFMCVRHELVVFSGRGPTGF